MMKKAKISQNKHAPSEWWTYFGFFVDAFMIAHTAMKAMNQQKIIIMANIV
ncbi:hypothetical protein [Listeria grandensis]|uniref:hypothetical protein n=1 Tax=Listeria grandensis TaxID=1494963 RepID=UPI0004ADE68F|nr:hypothetical protein [Listeria grandensis]